MRFKSMLGLCLAAIVLGVSACSGSDDDSSSNEGAGGVAQTGDAKAAAVEAADTDATAPAQLPKKKVGYIQFTNDAEVARRIQAGVEAAAKEIGWDFVDCDGQGDLRKIGTCGETLLNQNVDVMISNSTDATAVTRALKQSDAEDIPWFVVGGAVTENPSFEGIYVPDDKEMTRIIDEYAFDKLAESGGSQIAVMNAFPQILALSIRQDQFDADLADQPNAEVVGEHVIDFTNPIEDTRQATLEQLQKNPDLSLFYSVQNGLAPIAQAVKSKQIEERPLLTGFFGDLSNLDLIRSDEADAVVEWPSESDGWVAIDQAAAWFASDVKPAPNNAGLDYTLDFLEPVLVTSDNLPAEGEYADPPADFVSYFTEKWSKEYGAGK